MHREYYVAPVTVVPWWCPRVCVEAVGVFRRGAVDHGPLPSPAVTAGCPRPTDALHRARTVATDRVAVRASDVLYNVLLIMTSQLATSAAR